MKLRILAISSILLLASCSSYFVRKECEKVNWFQHAQDVAMRGQRLDEDARIKACEKANTDINSGELDRGFKLGMQNYCKLETARQKGASGEFFNYEFCEHGLKSRLKAQHNEGLKSFCQPENALTFASTGGVYKQQCPPEAEKNFMVSYRKGRQVYLKNKIASLNSQISSHNDLIQQKQNETHQLERRLLRLPQNTVVSKKKTYDKNTNTMVEDVSVNEDPEIASQRSNLEYKIDQLHREIKIMQGEQAGFRSEIHTLNGELDSLSSLSTTSAL